MKISVISTLLNEAGSVELFLTSLLSQTKKPDEIVIVDGGSRDGTIDIIQKVARRNPSVRLIVDPECNIRYTPSPVAKGRNIAIRSATGDILAVTDAGCRIDPAWLENITEPFYRDESIDVVGGWYEPWVDTKFERVAAAVTLTVTKKGIVEDYFPSSRSIAFRRRAWEKVGGYPEIALTAEDALFDKNLEQIGARYIFTDKAVVYWKPRGNLKSLLRQFYRYSKGDAICGIQGKMHARLFTKFLLFFLMIFVGIVTSEKFWLYLAGISVVAYMLLITHSSSYRGIRLRLSVTKIAMHVARLLGYCVGILKRIQGKGW